MTHCVVEPEGFYIAVREELILHERRVLHMRLPRSLDLFWANPIHIP